MLKEFQGKVYLAVGRLWEDKSHLLSAFDNVVKGYTFRQHCQEHSLSVCRKVRQCEKENILKTYCTQDLTVAAFRVTVALPLGGALCQLNSRNPYRPFGYPSGDAGHDHFV